MSLPMANGNEGGFAAWQVQDGSDASTASHDRKMSSFETMLLHHQHQQGSGGSPAVHLDSVPPVNGTQPLSIVSITDADRPPPANFLTNSFASSESIGPVRTDEFSTNVTRDRSRADTTSAFGSASASRQHHHHFALSSSQHHYDEDPHEVPPSTPPHSFSLYNATNKPSSDTHLDLSNLTTSSLLTRDSAPFTPTGSRDAGWGSARLSLGITSGSNHSSQTRPGATQSLSNNPFDTISPGSTPLQSNLSTNNNIISNISLSAPSPDFIPSQHRLPTTEEVRGPNIQVPYSMGHNYNVTDSSWALEEDKMERMTPEGKNRDGDDSTVQSTAVLSTATNEGVGDMLSPASSPRAAPVAAPAHEPEGQSTAVIGTPSTVSTAPSTEDASLGTDSVDKIGLKLDPSHLEPFSLHRRAPSWDRSPLSRNLYADTEISASVAPREHYPASAHARQHVGEQQWLPQQPSPAQAYRQQQQQQQLQQQRHQQPQQHPAQTAWGGQHTTQSRVASFRSDDSHKHDSRGSYGYAHAAQQRPQPQHQMGGERWQHPPRHFAGEGQLQFPGQQSRLHMQQQQEAAHGYRPTQGYNPYSMPRKPGYPPQHPLPPSQSPQRTTRGPRSQGPSPHRPQQHPGGPGGAGNVGSAARSSSEILKTLLRKKACLYEPDTSRAVALVTWLVGRELALEYGYFSRQQLQAGVHACVAEKIETGTITRTKVNRCMQIILNSCFHYIIPRPDGTEEKGHTFQAAFRKEVGDDAHLLRLLPTPWTDLVVNKDTVLKASASELEGKEPRSNQASPKGSPTLKPVENRSPGRGDQADGDGADSKRAVLLCFNENVRGAEDVFRCHNEFIRDSAHSSNLQLTAQEWRIFFGKEAANTPRIWGNVGIPVVAVESADGSGRKVDVLGQMTPEEAGKFRTTWCAKRYDHDHEFCGMAHVEVNGGWLRRDPNVHWYKDEFCSSIIRVAEKRGSSSFYVINECPNGENCKFAHSLEEMMYHPHRYKSKPCGSNLRTGLCRFGDICPNLHHPSDNARPLGKKGGDGRSGGRHGRSGSHSGGKNSAALPTGSPILYASPAPVSSFEKHLLMPGLQNLFRRQCTVVRAHLRNPKCRCCYSYFGDDMGVEAEGSGRQKTPRQGLPPSMRM